MRARIVITLLVLSLPLAAGCGDGGGLATAPDPEALGFEGISTAEISASGFLDDLSDEDKAAIRAALQAARAEIREIVADFREGEITREEARAQIAAVHDRLIETLGQFLTDEQIERLLHHRPGHPRPDLDLTDEQVAAIQALRAEYHAFVQDVRQQVHDGEITAEEGRRLVRQKAHETRRAFCAILTPDQQAKVRFCHAPEGSRG
jgi:uncharacterized membrane protein